MQHKWIKQNHSVLNNSPIISAQFWFQSWLYSVLFIFTWKAESRSSDVWSKDLEGTLPRKVTASLYRLMMFICFVVCHILDDSLLILGVLVSMFVATSPSKFVVWRVFDNSLLILGVLVSMFVATSPSKFVFNVSLTNCLFRSVY